MIYFILLQFYKKLFVRIQETCWRTIETGWEWSSDLWWQIHDNSKCRYSEKGKLSGVKRYHSRTKPGAADALVHQHHHHHHLAHAHHYPKWIESSKSRSDGPFDSCRSPSICSLGSVSTRADAIWNREDGTLFGRNGSNCIRWRASSISSSFARWRALKGFIFTRNIFDIVLALTYFCSLEPEHNCYWAR